MMDASSSRPVSRGASFGSPWIRSTWALAWLLGALWIPFGSLQGQSRAILTLGFEEPVLTIDWDYVDANLIPGWNSTEGIVELWRSGFNGVPAPEGNQFAEANSTGPVGFFQDVCLVAGEQVDWSFYHRGRAGLDSVLVELGGVELARVGTGTGAWVQYTGTYTAPSSGPARIEFTPLNQGSLGNFVDEVRFNFVPHVEFGPDTGAPENSGGGPNLFISGIVDAPGTVEVTVTGGSALGGDDLTATVLTVDVPAGTYDGTLATAIPVDLGVVNDGIAEGDETVELSLSNATGPLRLANADAAACGAAVRLVSTYTIQDDDEADLSTVKVEDQPAAVGTPTPYVITTTNAGPQPAVGVVVTDTLPPGASLVSATRGGVEGGGVVTWPAVDTLGVGLSVVDTLVITYAGVGTFQQVAASTFSGTDPDPGNNRAAVPVDLCGGAATVSDVAGLRAAIAEPCVDTVFVNPGTYLLTSSGSGQLLPAQDKVILNAGGGRAVLDAGGASRVLEIGSGTNVVVEGLTLTGGSVPGNQDGGGIRVFGNLVIRNSTISGNFANDDGGGLFMQNGSTVLAENVTISGNTAGGQGAGADLRSGGRFVHVTVAGNSGGRPGSGIHTRGAGPILANTLVADNSGPGVDGVDGNFSSNGSNLIEGGCGSCLPSDLTVDPDLQPLGDNGGLSFTHALGSGSAAIDAAAAGDALPSDQRGVSRPLGGGFDIGAFEAAPPGPVRSVSVTPDGLPGPAQRSEGTGYRQDFTVQNDGAQVEDVDLFVSVAGGGGPPFVTLDSLRAVGGVPAAAIDSLRIPGLAAGASAVVAAYYSVAPGTVGAVDTLRAVARVAADPAVADPGRAEVEYVCGSGTVTVSTMAELRAAAANPCVNTIGVDPGVYDLTSSGSGPLVLDRAVTVFNTGGGEVRLDGGGVSRVLEVPVGGDATMTGITLQNGFDSGAGNRRGGGAYVEGRLEFSRGAIVGNATGNDGGGLALGPSGTLILENVTVSGNTSSDRGAGLDLAGTAILVHVTVAENSAGGPAGGINVRSGTTTLQNSLVADNSQGSGSQINSPGTLVSNGFNLVEGGCPACAPSDLTGDPDLEPLADNGGDSRTHALGSGSIARDAASPGDALGTDQRGVVRPQGSGPDMGAYEAAGGTPGVRVTPDSTAASRLPSNGVVYSESYLVENTGTSTASYVLAGFSGGSAVTVDSIVGPGLLAGATPDSAATPDLAPGATTAVTVWYTVLDVAEGSSDAVTLSARDAGSPGTQDAGAVSVTVIRPAITLTKLASTTGDPLPGSAVTYQIQVTNSGSGPAENVTVLDSIPVETVFQLGSPSQTLPPGIGVTLEFADSPGAWGYTPTSGGCGASAGLDACVRYIRWTLSDTLSAESPQNQGEFIFRALIR